MKMSDVDLLIESTINEAPVGMLKRGALKVASKLGSQKAAGQEVTANIANQLKKEYSRYLGVTGYEPDKESIEAFLNSKGLSSDSLDTAISSVSDTGPTGQDWRIDTGPRTGATNQRVEPVVDIGSATDEVPALDGESPIEQARAKRIAAQQKAVQQLRGQQPTQAEPTAKPNRLAGMGAGYVPPTEPTAQEPEVAQQEPSATGTQAASALGRLKTPQNPMKGRTSLVSKLKGQQAAPEVPASPTSQEKWEADKLQALNDAKAALAANPKDKKLQAELKKAEEDYDDALFALVEPEDDFSTGSSPVSPRQRPGISARASKAGVSQPKVPQFTSASAMSKATAEKKAELDTKLQAIDDAKAALANSPRSGKLKDALKQAEADYDAFVSSEIKPADLKDKLATKVDQIKSGEPEPTGQMELPTEEPVNTQEVEKVQSAVEKAQAEYDKVNKAGISKSTKDKKLKALNTAKAELASATGTEPEVVPAPEPVSMQSPVTAVKPEKPAAVKAEPKSEPADNIGKLTAKAQELAAEFKKDPTNKALGKQAMDAISALKAAKEAEVEPEDSDYTPTGMSSEFSRFAKAMPSASKKSSSEEEPTPAADDEDAWMDQEPMPKAKKEKAAKNKKMALAASVEHEFDYLLAEAALTNKQVDKIILAVTQDNIRKGIISIPGVPKPKAKDKGKTTGDQYSIGSAGSSQGGSTGGVGDQQYTQPAKQKSGGKTIDMSIYDIRTLLSALDDLQNKKDLDESESRQLEKLIRQLGKLLREARASLANQLTEAPMGLGQRLATGVASKFSAQAAGKLDAGKIANQYKPEYSRWLGTTGANPDAQSLIDFFQSKRLDTSKIQQIADSVAPNATRLTGQQLDSIIMQITQENIRNGKITPGAAAQASGQPAATQSTLPVMAQRMLTDPAVQSHPEYVRFLSGLK